MLKWKKEDENYVVGYFNKVRVAEITLFFQDETHKSVYHACLLFNAFDNIVKIGSTLKVAKTACENSWIEWLEEAGLQEKRRDKKY
jgi:hypothetical protein